MEGKLDILLILIIPFLNPCPHLVSSSSTLSASKVPNPLPSSVSSNISKAIFRLLREEEEIEDQYGSAFADSRHFPRMDGESLAEREFRIAIAQQICGLIRGYQECLFFVSASQPVFNRDRFLRQAPALFEGRKGAISALSADYAAGSTTGIPFGTQMSQSQRLISPRSKRFLSGLVNTQLFHALLETLDLDELAFFHEIMDSFDVHEDGKSEMPSSLVYGSASLNRSAKRLGTTLDLLEEAIPTYHVHRHWGVREMSMDSIEAEDDEFVYDSNETFFSSFTSQLFQAVNTNPSSNDLIRDQHKLGTHVSLQQLVELEKKPWEYRGIFDISLFEDGENGVNSVFWRKIYLKEAIGEQNFR